MGRRYRKGQDGCILYHRKEWKNKPSNSVLHLKKANSKRWRTSGVDGFRNGASSDCSWFTWVRKGEQRKKKPCDCWNEETSRNPKQYVEKITSQWAKPKINTECWQNQRRTHLPHRWSVQESTMSHVWMCKCVCTSGRNRRHGILGQIRLGLLFLDHSIIRVLFPYALNASCHVYANRLTTWLSLGLQEKHPTACW